MDMHQTCILNMITNNPKNFLTFQDCHITSFTNHFMHTYMSIMKRNRLDPIEMVFRCFCVTMYVSHRVALVNYKISLVVRHHFDSLPFAMLSVPQPYQTKLWGKLNILDIKVKIVSQSRNTKLFFRMAIVQNCNTVALQNRGFHFQPYSGRSANFVLNN